MSTNSTWTVVIDGEKRGGLTSTEIRTLASTGLIDPTTLMWRPGMKNWIPAREVQGLAFPSDSPPPLPASSPSLLHQPPQQEPEPVSEELSQLSEASSASSRPRPRRRRRKSNAGLYAMVALLVLACISGVYILSELSSRDEPEQAESTDTTSPTDADQADRDVVTQVRQHIAEGRVKEAETLFFGLRVNPSKYKPEEIEELDRELANAQVAQDVTNATKQLAEGEVAQARQLLTQASQRSSATDRQEADRLLTLMMDRLNPETYREAAAELSAAQLVEALEAPLLDELKTGYERLDEEIEKVHRSVFSTRLLKVASLETERVVDGLAPVSQAMSLAAASTFDHLSQIGRVDDATRSTARRQLVGDVMLDGETRSALRSYIGHTVVIGDDIWHFEQAAKRVELAKWEKLGRDVPELTKLDWEDGPLWVSLDGQRRAQTFDEALRTSLPNARQIQGTVDEVVPGVGSAISGMDRGFCIGLTNVEKGDQVRVYVVPAAAAEVKRADAIPDGATVCRLVSAPDHIRRPTMSELVGGLIDNDQTSVRRFDIKEFVAVPSKTHTEHRRFSGWVVATKTTRTKTKFGYQFEEYVFEFKPPESAALDQREEERLRYYPLPAEDVVVELLETQSEAQRAALLKPQ